MSELNETTHLRIRVCVAMASDCCVGIDYWTDDTTPDDEFLEDNARNDLGHEGDEGITVFFHEFWLPRPQPIEGESEHE